MSSLLSDSSHHPLTINNIALQHLKSSAAHRYDACYQPTSFLNAKIMCQLHCKRKSRDPFWRECTKSLEFRFHFYYVTFTVTGFCTIILDPSLKCKHFWWCWCHPRRCNQPNKRIFATFTIILAFTVTFTYLLSWAGLCQEHHTHWKATHTLLVNRPRD